MTVILKLMICFNSFHNSKWNIGMSKVNNASVCKKKLKKKKPTRPLLMLLAGYIKIKELIFFFYFYSGCHLYHVI